MALRLFLCSTVLAFRLAGIKGVDWEKTTRVSGVYNDSNISHRPCPSSPGHATVSTCKSLANCQSTHGEHEVGSSRWPYRRQGLNLILICHAYLLHRRRQPPLPPTKSAGDKVVGFLHQLLLYTIPIEGLDIPSPNALIFGV